MGDDRALADAVADQPPGVRVGWRPDPSSDFARVVSAATPGDATTPGVELPCDVLEVGTPDCERVAVNMVVLGTAPDRQRRATRAAAVRVVVDGRPVHDGPATAVLVANGEYLRAADVIPRGHPGDGRAEVQVYAVRGGERAEMRRRLRRGDHLPHPAIRQVSGRRVEVEALDGRLALELDGHADRAGLAGGTRLVARVRPGAFVLVT